MTRRSLFTRGSRELAGCALTGALAVVSCLHSAPNDEPPPGWGAAGSVAGGSGALAASGSGGAASGTSAVAGTGGLVSGGTGAGSSNSAGTASAGSSGLAGSAGAAGIAGTGGNAGALGSAGAGGAMLGGAGGGVSLDPDGCPIVPALKLTRVATLTASPMALAQPTGDSRRFIAERPGRILILEDDALAATPFLDIRANIAPEETERGLLSFALHPNFAQNGRFYVVYTRAANDPFTPDLTSVGDLVLAEGRASTTNPDLAEPELRVFLTVPKSVRYHNGGMIAFSKDGTLFMSVGEDGCAYTPMLSPMLQKRDNRLGKLLRIDVENPAVPPAGNFTDGDPYVWDYGFRNPWRLSVDRKTGDLYVGDLGEGSWEEINFEPFGQGQKNYGWPLAEGNHCSPNTSCELADFAAPVHEFAHTGAGSVDGRCGYDDELTPRECNRAVVGGYVYRGAALPELDGRYFYGDFINNTVSSLIVKDGAATCHAEHRADLVSSETPIQGLVSFSEDAAGELYLLDLLGNVYRIERDE